MPGVVVVGAGGHAREILELIAAVPAEGRPEVVGVIDDGGASPELLARHGVANLGTSTELGRFAGAAFVLGIGDPAARRRLDELATAAGLHPLTLVHPTAVVGRTVDLGPGTMVAAQAVLTADLSTGRHAHVNHAATVHHDCRLGDWSFVGPGCRITGAVTIGAGAFVGAGVTVLPGRSVGDWSVVGAGAVVTTDVAERTTVAGVPAAPVAANR